MNMISTCGSIAHAQFAHKKKVDWSLLHVSWHRKQGASHWPLQPNREMKDIHIAKFYSSPIYSKTLVTENKLLENRMRPQFLLSSNYSSSYIHSYSSNGESSDNLSEVTPEPDASALDALAALAVGVIMLSSNFGVPFKQSIPCVVVIIGLSLAFMFRKRLGYLLGALNLPFGKPVKDSTVKLGKKLPANGVSSDNLSANQAPPELDIEDSLLPLPEIALIICGVIMLPLDSSAPFKQSYLFINGLLLLVACQRLGYSLIALYFHLTEPSSKGDTEKKSI